MDNLKEWLLNKLFKSNLSEEWSSILATVILFAGTLIAAWISFIIFRTIIKKLVYPIIRKTKTDWDDALLKSKLFSNISHIIPAIIFIYALPILFVDGSTSYKVFNRLLDVYLTVVTINIIITLLKSTEDFLTHKKAFIEKPIASYFQLFRIIVYIAGGIMVLSLLMGKSPLYFLGAFGAMTAILLLVFKDTILGLVASVQISTNDMIRVGDWVEMPKYNADGDVIAINLNTVKIRNWDKTISTIPTHYFITDSFKNWRGMQESGGRRIKRSIFLNVNSVKFIKPEDREELKKIQIIKPYLDERQSEIESFNTLHNIDTSILINGRRLTNIGVFRQYIENYLKSHPRINQDMTLLVRQLPSGEHGLPIEIYCFTRTTNWNEYETIQSDIFDHLFSAVHFFGLEIFQSPSGSDFHDAFK